MSGVAGALGPAAAATTATPFSALISAAPGMASAAAATSPESIYFGEEPTRQSGFSSPSAAAPVVEGQPVTRQPQGNPSAPVVGGRGPGRDMSPYRNAIKAIESGGRYDIVGATHPRYGRALGAYQIMESNLPIWSREALGRVVTPEEFLRSPEIQDAIFDHRFGGYIDRFGRPEDAASAWLTGQPYSRMKGRSTADVHGTNADKYVAMFNKHLGRGTSFPAGGSASPVAVAQGSGVPDAGRRPQPQFDDASSRSRGGSAPSISQDGAEAGGSYVVRGQTDYSPVIAELRGRIDQATQRALTRRQNLRPQVRSAEA